LDLVKVKAKESFGLSGRLGGMVTDNTGLYARLGWQSTKFKARSEEYGLAGSTTQDAFVYGAGLETRLSPAASLRIEYLIEDYGSAGLNSDLGVGGIRVDNNKLSAGVSYRF
jgi:outer membrane immunogenic protein